jgi:hypothetical protein
MGHDNLSSQSRRVRECGRRWQDRVHEVVETVPGLTGSEGLALLDEILGKMNLHQISKKYPVLLVLGVVEERRERRSTKTQILRKCLWASLRSCERTM